MSAAFSYRTELRGLRSKLVVGLSRCLMWVGCWVYRVVFSFLWSRWWNGWRSSCVSLRLAWILIFGCLHCAGCPSPSSWVLRVRDGWFIHRCWSLLRRSRFRILLSAVGLRFVTGLAVVTAALRVRSRGSPRRRFELPSCSRRRNRLNRMCSACGSRRSIRWAACRRSRNCGRDRVWMSHRMSSCRRGRRRSYHLYYRIRYLAKQSFSYYCSLPYFQLRDCYLASRRSCNCLCRWSHRILMQDHLLVSYNSTCRWIQSICDMRP